MDFKDPLIREALRQIRANVPPLSDDFNEKLFAKLEQRRRQRRIRRLVLWPSIAAAVAARIAIAFVFGKGVTNKNTNEGDFAGIKKESVPVPAATSPATSANINTAKAPKSVNKLGEMVAPISREEMEPPAVAEANIENNESAPVPQELIAEEPSAPEPLLASDDEAGNAEAEEDMPMYNVADLPIINMENYAYTKEEIKKVEELHKQRLIADIKSTVERWRYKLSQMDITFSQD